MGVLRTHLMSGTVLGTRESSQIRYGFALEELTV